MLRKRRPRFAGGQPLRSIQANMKQHMIKPAGAPRRQAGGRRAATRALIARRTASRAISLSRQGRTLRDDSRF